MMTYGSDDEFEEPEYPNKVFKCTTCGKFKILTLTEEEMRRAQACPKCDTKLVWAKDDDALSGFPTCAIVTCSQYLSTAATGDTIDRCEGKRTDKKGDCKKPLEVLTMEAVQALPDSSVEEVDDSDAKPVRQLKALTKQSLAWVKGSGSHHRSTGGSHTSAAREKHSAASGSKDKVRDRFIENLKELIAQVGDLTETESSKKAVKDGKDAMSKLGGK
ncbi:hypothetical protein QEZ54_32515 [Catellatospora sp. KI3]|uniref:hypothetical protein n=1 Tax=Catellatospora sp. KI3 TaxID=3041620 RepID=UPI0024822E67|nr:hypothetical protein [Catellatospora sp. KI3]MDI1465706.1 hypothetical protein [Catellatospora sp. KI3]